MKTHYFKILILSLFAFLVSASTLSVSTDYVDLVKEHAPILWFDSQEEYFPCDYSHVFYNEQREELDGELAKTKYDLLSKTDKINKIEAFYKVFDQGDVITIQYHLFYVYNNFTNKHYGDAESITIILDKDTKTVIGSAHIGSVTKIAMANNMAVFAKEDNTAVLIENGSHANYPDKDGNGMPGAQELDNWYNAYGITGRTEIDVFNGPKIWNYKLTPLDDLNEKLQGKGLEKSESLGWQFNIKGEFLGLDFNKTLTIPIGGDVADITTSNLATPKDVIPFTFGEIVYNYSEQNPYREDIARKIVKEEPVKEAKEESKKEIKEESVKENSYIKELEEENRNLKQENQRLKTILEEREILLKMKKQLDELQKQLNNLKQVKGISISKLQRLRITEIASGVENANNEYVQIYNPNDIDLKIDDTFKFYTVSSSNKKTNKTLEFNIDVIPANEYILLYAGDESLTDNISAMFKRQITQEGGVILEYKEEIMDRVAWGENPPELATETKGIQEKLKTDHCLKRLKDTDNNYNDFEVSQNCIISVKEENETDETKKSDDTPSGEGVSTETQPEFYPIIINEIMYNPKGVDLEREWIEIYNDSDLAVDLTNFRFYENNVMHKLETMQGSIILQAKEYAVITKDNFSIVYPNYTKTILKSSFSLNNTGEKLALYNKDLLIDEYEYSASIGANENGNSLQLFDNGWKESIPTPGEKNVYNVPSTTIVMETTEPTTSSAPTSTELVATTTEPVIETPTTSPASTLYINEVMYNPDANDTDREWIELFYDGDNIENYVFFEDDTNHRISLYQTNTSSTYVIIANDITGFLNDYPECTSTIATSSFILENSTTTLIIKKEDENIDEFTYNTSMGADNNSYSLQLIENEWKESIPTPGQENVLELYPDPTYSGVDPELYNIFFFQENPTSTPISTEPIATSTTPTTTEPISTTTEPIIQEPTTTEPIATTTIST